MSILRANSFQNTNGTPYQTIVQVRQFLYDSVYENTVQNSEYDMPGLLGNGTVTITPFFATSRILIRAWVQAGQEDTWRQNYHRIYYRINNGSWIFLPFATFGSLVYIASMNGCMATFHTEYLASFGTTNKIDFKMTNIGHANGGYLHLNQNSITNTTAATNTYSVASGFTLYEVLQ